MTYVIPERNAVVIPKHRLGLKGEGYEVFPYKLNIFQSLIEIGIRLPGPIRTQYSFRSRFDEPFKHQIATADFLSQKRRAFVFNDIGTAKTLSALWAIDYMMDLGFVHNVLICSTLSTLQKVWGDEIFKSMNDRGYVILHGSRESRRKKLNKEVRFYIINHDGLKTICDWDRRDPEKPFITGSWLDDRPDIDLILVDECAEFRNQSTDRYRALKWVIGDRWLWMMSGSPMPRAPTDVWAPARLVCPHLVDRSFVRFRDRVMTQFGQYNWVPKPGWEQIVFDILKDSSIRFTRDQCLDLPPCVTETRHVEMSKEQKKAYEEMRKQFRIELKNGEITAANEAVKRNKLLQIACGTVFSDDRKVAYLDCKDKFKDLGLLVDESGKKLIIYAPFRPAIQMIADKLRKQYLVATVDGSTPLSLRNRYFQEFQHGPLEVIVAHPKCMAHGIDLTRSHTVCWWSPVDDFAVYEQAGMRITRPGQTMKQTIIHLECSPIEALIYKRLKNKETMQGLLLDLLTAKV